MHAPLGRWLANGSVASWFLMRRLIPAAFAFSFSSASVVSRRGFPATLLHWTARSFPPFWQKPPVTTLEHS